MLKHLRKREDFEQKNLLQKGFTLVELLVVIVILGILAAVVVFAVGGSTDDAQSNACSAEEATVASAVEAYRAKAGSYPTNAAAMVSEANGGSLDPEVAEEAELIFLRSIPENHTVGAGGTITATGDCA